MISIHNAILFLGIFIDLHWVLVINLIYKL